MSDPLNKEQRSYCMSRVRSRDTDIERVVQYHLRRLGYRFKTHPNTVLGRPDIYMPGIRVAVFIDGDFWHGHRFNTWESALSPFWQVKIRTNIQRDKRVRKSLRSQGINVVRIWQHDLELDTESCIVNLVNVIECS